MGFDLLDQAQVGQLGLAVGRDNDAVGLHIAVDELVRACGSGAGHLRDEADRFGLGQRPRAPTRSLSRSPSTYSMTRYGSAPSMPKSSARTMCGSCSALRIRHSRAKRSIGLLPARLKRGQHLDRHQLAADLVPALVHRPHAAGGEPVEQYPVADGPQNLVLGSQRHTALPLGTRFARCASTLAHIPAAGAGHRTIDVGRPVQADAGRT